MQVRRYIRRPEVLAKTGLSATTIYLLEKRNEMPRHFMLTPRCAVWDEAEIDAWILVRRGNPALLARVPDQAMRKSRPGRGKRVADAVKGL